MPVPVSTRPPLKRALSIAVQYSSLRDFNLDLPGTPNDPKILSDLLVEVYNYKREDILILLDDDASPHPPPTRENIERAMKELVADAQPGDHFVFHFSGHGAQVPNLDGTEKSGFDDVIWPADVKFFPDDGNFDNYIKDDEIHDVLVNHVPVGAHFMMVFDCCHSGTMADLPYESEDCPPPSPSSTTSGGISIPTPNVKNIRVRGSHDVPSQDGPERKIAKEQFTPAVPVTHNPNEPQTAVADVTAWSACEDNQETLGGPRGGVFVNAFARALRRNPMASHQELLNGVTHEIAKITAKLNARRTGVDEPKFETPTPELEANQPIGEVMTLPLDI
ncbi:peptidase C14, caspase domain-containing protein [Fomitopsis betulina]|nr:peptidase C14, caspase domain-containing protein [Fomitopsis betulina]